jgi:hypothetical protein
MYLRETGYEAGNGLNWLRRVQWLAFVKTICNFRLLKIGEFMGRMSTLPTAFSRNSRTTDLVS